MDNQLPYPSALQHRLLFTLLSGIAVIAISATIHTVTQDKTLFCLGGIVFIGCLFRCCSLWEIIVKRKYEVVAGTCIGVIAPPLRRYQKVTLMDENGIESSLLLQKQSRITIGKQYRFYFKKNCRPILGNSFLDSSLSADLFLGYEELNSPQ